IGVGEFNGDGRKDIAVTSSGEVSILLGWGDGTFQGTWNYDLGRGSTFSALQAPTVAVGEFNGDGISDLAVAVPSPGRLLVLLGNGDGSFRQVFDFEAGSVSSLAVGEFNGDRIQDLVIALSGGVAVLLGNGNGTFQPPVNLPAVSGPSS